MKAQIGACQWNGCQTNVLILIGTINQNAVPIDLQVGGDANALGALRQTCR